MTPTHDLEGTAVSDLTGQRWRIRLVRTANGAAEDEQHRSEVLVTLEPPGLRLLVDQSPDLITRSDVARALNRRLGLLAA